MTDPRPGAILLLAQGRAGDRLGARLAPALKAALPEHRLVGAGGPGMAAAGIGLLAETSELSAMGYSGLLPVLPRALAEARKLGRALRGPRLDCLIVIDAWQPLNYLMRMIPELAAAPKVCYMPPGPNLIGMARVHAACAAAFEAIICPFPHQLELFARAGARVRPAAHGGLLTALEERGEPQTAREAMVAILPGSRPPEVTSELPHQVEAMAALQERDPRLQPLLCLAGPEVEARTRGVLPGATRSYGARAAMSRATMGLICSGTASLEAAVLGCPGVVSYHGTLSQRLEWRLFHVKKLTALRQAGIASPYIAMPNIIAGREIYPEVIGQPRGTVARRALELLDSGIEERREELATLTEALPWDDPGQAVAEEVVRTLSSRSR